MSLVERLRQFADALAGIYGRDHPNCPPGAKLVHEAGDEIERLQAALRLAIYKLLEYEPFKSRHPMEIQQELLAAAQAAEGE